MNRRHDQEDLGTPGIMYTAPYARASTAEQGKGLSIPTQIEACQGLVERYAENRQAQGRHAECDVRRGMAG